MTRISQALQTFARCFHRQQNRFDFFLLRYVRHISGNDVRVRENVDKKTKRVQAIRDEIASGMFLLARRIPRRY